MAMEQGLSGEQFIAWQCHSLYFSLLFQCLWTLLSRLHGDCTGNGDLCGDDPIAALWTCILFQIVSNCSSFIVYLSLVVYDVHVLLFYCIVKFLRQEVCPECFRDKLILYDLFPHYLLGFEYIVFTCK